MNLWGHQGGHDAALFSRGCHRSTALYASVSLLSLQTRTMISHLMGDLCGVAAILYLVLERGIVGMECHWMVVEVCLFAVRVP
jgi:hypothetical protein